MIIAVYESKKRDICYYVMKAEDFYYIEANVAGGFFSERAAAGNSEEKSLETARLFAEKSVHPVHIEDILSDLHF